MNFFTATLLVAMIVAASAIEQEARKLESAPKEIEPSAGQAEQPALPRGRRGLLHTHYSAPLTAAAVEVAAPVAYTYSASLPYAYPAYRAYAPYYSYPTVYV